MTTPTLFTLQAHLVPRRRGAWHWALGRSRRLPPNDRCGPTVCRAALPCTLTTLWPAACWFAVSAPTAAPFDRSRCPWVTRSGHGGLAPLAVASGGCRQIVTSVRQLPSSIECANGSHCNVLASNCTAHRHVVRGGIPCRPQSISGPLPSECPRDLGGNGRPAAVGGPTDLWPAAARPAAAQGCLCPPRPP